LRSIQLFAVFSLAFAAPVIAQNLQSSEAKSGDAKPDNEITVNVPLANIAQQNDLNEIQVDLRNMFAHLKIYSVAGQNIISIHGTPEDVHAATKMISELDRPKKIYRLTYTLTDMDGAQRTGTRAYSLIVASGDNSQLRQGGKMPIVTGSFQSQPTEANTQVQYMDVGLKIDASVDGFADGVRLRSKVEESSLSDEKSGVGPQDPILHQTVLDGTTTLALGKPLVLGSVDVPGSTRRQEIAVVADLVK
jgi:type II secretory pathway component GspD/PulD (secretin)